MDEGVACDPKKAACTLMELNCPARHHFLYMADACSACTSPTPCILHPESKSCSYFFEDKDKNGGKRTGIPADVCIGFPRAPYSFQRAGRFLADESEGNLDGLTDSASKPPKNKSGQRQLSEKSLSKPLFLNTPLSLKILSAGRQEKSWMAKVS